MGSVDLVMRRSDGFERLYAMKRLHPHLRQDSELVEMFLSEARLGGLIRHTNVIGVLDVGRDSEGPYFVMEYVEGRSLNDVLKTTIRAQRSIPVQVCVRIAAQVADGLHAAHELRDADGRPLNLVHRDVSPHNILVGYDGTCRLTDFGIAKVWGASTQTSAGVLKGKKGYTSPEQVRLETLDRRSDLFSLGVVLFEMLGGRRLYAGEQSAVLRAILQEPPPDVGELRHDVPPALSELLFRLLAKERELRPASADEVARTLRNVLTKLVSDEGTITVSDFMDEVFPGQREADRARVLSSKNQRQHPPIPPSPPTSRRKLAIAGVVALCLAAALAIGLARRPREQHEPRRPIPAPTAPPQAPRATTLPVPAATADNAPATPAAPFVPTTTTPETTQTGMVPRSTRRERHPSRRAPRMNADRMNADRMSAPRMSDGPRRPSPWRWPG